MMGKNLNSNMKTLGWVRKEYLVGFAFLHENHFINNITSGGNLHFENHDLEYTECDVVTFRKQCCKLRVEMIKLHEPVQFFPSRRYPEGH